MKIEYTCKLCGIAREFFIVDSDACDPEQMGRVGKLLVCNPCADLREKFKRAQDQIFKICAKLDRLALLRVDADESARIRHLSRQALIFSTRKYAEAMAVYRRLSEVMWHEDFVDHLMERPQSAWAILRAYGDGLRSRPRQQEFA